MIVFRPEILPDREYAFTHEEIRHIKARRLQNNDAILLSDGKGVFCNSLYTNQKFVLGTALLRIPVKSRQRILCTAVPEPKRWNWLLQKATELGVSEIYPILWQRSERRQLNYPKCQKIIQEACVQSKRLILPDIHAMQTPAELAKLIQQTDAQNVPQFFILEPDAPTTLYEQCPKGDGDFVFFIGPEGGFVEKDIAELKLPALKRVRLGHQILRIETAALAVLAATLY